MQPYSVIVVARDQPRLLLSTLLHVRTHAEPAEVLVVDNASTSNLSNIVPLAQLPVRMIRSEEHLSLGAAINMGIDVAEHDTILLLHNDVFLQNSPAVAIDHLINHPEVGIVGAKLFMPGEEPRKLRLTGYKVDDHRHGAKEIGRERWDTLQETVNVSATSTACMVIRRTDLRFDERYWFDMDDVDFGLQHLQHGLQTVIHPDLHAIHVEQGGLRERLISVEWGVLTMVSRLLFHERWCSSLPIHEHPLQPAMRGGAATSERLARVNSVISAPGQGTAPGEPVANRPRTSRILADARLVANTAGERTF